MDIGAPELIVILLIVVIFFGSGRLSKLGGELGTAIRAFRQGLEDIDHQQADREYNNDKLPDNADQKSKD